MSKLLTVVGATGTQGGSVIRAALKEGTWKIRGVTRNTNSDAAKALSAQGVEMVAADLNDLQSLIHAFHSSTAIFAVTDFFEPFAASGPDHAIEVESLQGINLARAAAATPTLEHYIWSTLPNGSAISAGKYLVPHFESKNRIDAFIRADAGLAAKTTFLWVTFYASNFLYPMFTPNMLKSSGKYLQLSVAASETPVHTIGDTAVNVGVFVLATLRRPEVALRRTVLAKVATLSAGEMLQTWAKVTGNKAEYVKVNSEAFDALWPMWGQEMGVMLEFWDEAKEKSWSGEEIIGAEELGIKADELVGLETAFKAIDWSSVL